MKKADMAEAAERLLDGRSWLPPVLRTAAVEAASEGEGEAGQGDAAVAVASDDDAYPFAAE